MLLCSYVWGNGPKPLAPVWDQSRYWFKSSDRGSWSIHVEIPGRLLEIGDQSSGKKTYSDLFVINITLSQIHYSTVSEQSFEDFITIIHTLQMRRLRLRELKSPAQGHTAQKRTSGL